MPIKLKPSSKEYIKNSNGKSSSKYRWIHYTVTGAKTEELLKLRNVKPKKRNVIENELKKRGVTWEVSKKK
jgi:hypothetical protein